MYISMREFQNYTSEFATQFANHFLLLLMIIKDINR